VLSPLDTYIVASAEQSYDAVRVSSRALVLLYLQDHIPYSSRSQDGSCTIEMVTQISKVATVIVGESMEILMPNSTDDTPTKSLIGVQKIEQGERIPLAINNSQFSNFGEVRSVGEPRPYQRRRDSVTNRWVRIPTAEQIREELKIEIEEEEQREHEMLELSDDDADGEDECVCGYWSDLGDQCFCAIAVQVEAAAEELDMLREEVKNVLYSAGEKSWRAVVEAERKLERAKSHHKALQREMERWKAPY
jgi:hypothetical protein